MTHVHKFKAAVVSTVVMAALLPTTPARAAVPRVGGGVGWVAVVTSSESQPQRIHVISPAGRDHVIGTTRLDRAFVSDFSNDGHRVLVTSAKGQGASKGQDFEVYDLVRGTVTRGHARSEALRFLDPAGTQLLAQMDRAALARTDLTGKILTRYVGTESTLVEGALPTTDGRRVLASDTTGRIRLFDAKTGRLQRIFALPKGFGWCMPRWNASATTFDAQCGADTVRAVKVGNRTDVVSYRLDSSVGADRTSRIPLAAAAPTGYNGLVAVGRSTYLVGNDRCYGMWMGQPRRGAAPVAERWWRPGAWPQSRPVAGAVWSLEPISKDPGKCNGWGRRLVQHDLAKGTTITSLTEPTGGWRLGVTSVAEPMG